MTGSGTRAPKVFVSYSWDDEEHREWVHAFATRLREDGVYAELDQWEVHFGDPLTEFMERAVRENDFALVVCTPKYKERSDGRIGGVGYEGDIMTAEVLSQRNHRKFIPVLRRGDWSNAFPSWLSGKKGADLRGDPYREEQYEELVDELHGQAPGPPPLGQRPTGAASVPDDRDPSVPDNFGTSDSHRSGSPVDPAESEGARQQLENLPVEDVPEQGAGLPPQSVMRLRPNTHFVGRCEDLKRIAANLKAGGATAIGEVTVAASSGLGGVGKTQLACEFVYRYGRFFHGVYWLNFGEPAEIPAEVASCGGAGGMNLRPYDYYELPVKERVRAVMAEWQNDLPRLLVFDNCEDEGLLDQWLPSAGGCRVLVTSRRGSWDPSLGVTDLKLGVLERWESVTLLREHRPDLPADAPDLDAIAKELGDLPLALDLAGRYLDKYRREMTPASYLADIRRPELLEHPSLRRARGISPTKHDMDVWRTFAVSYWRLDADDERDATATRLLARAARLAAGEPIPDYLLAWTLEPPDGDGAPPDPSTTVRDTLDRLTDLGLLERSGGEALTMHRLVATFALAEAPDNGAQAAVEAACGRAAGRAYREGRPAEQEALLPHVRFVTDSAKGRVDAMAANLCTALNLSLRQLGAYDEALRYADRAWAISVELYGREGRATLQRRSNVGTLLEGKGDRTQARSIYEEVLEAQERRFGQDDPDVAATLNNLGASFSRDDLYHKTLPLYRRALDIRDGVWQRTGPQDPDREENAYEAAEGHSNMGALMMDLGRPRQAGPHFDRALNIMVGEFGEDHERNAGTLVKRGAALRALGRYLEAVTSVTSALDIYRGVTRTVPPAAGAALANLGSILAELAEEDGVYEEPRGQLREMAGGWLQAALTGSERGYGEDHPITGGLHRALGAVRVAQGAAEDARVHLERAEGCRRLNLRGADAEAAVVISGAGRSLTDWGLYDEAQAYLERALDVREDVLGERNFDTSTSLFNLGVLLQLRGQDGRARPYLQRALAARSDICGEDHPATQVVRDNLRLLES